jgi:zinc and cadmium transporter
MSAGTSALIASTLSSIFGLAGGFLLLWQRQWVNRFSRFFISFAAGAMLGAAFFDVLKEAITDHPNQVASVFAWTLVGFLFFFLVEKLLLWHHHGHGHEDEPETTLGYLVIIGDSIHNFIDGTIIAAAFLASPVVGVVTALAVFFHEIPQEIGDFAIMLHSGMKRHLVFWWNLGGALISPVGAVLTILVARHVSTLILPLLGIAAGNFIYIAAADLIPQIHRERKLLVTLGQFSLLIAGMGIIIILSRVLGG